MTTDPTAAPTFAAPPDPARAAGEPWALFLDVDGTLIEFADSPDAVRVADGLVDLLQHLETALDGALALVSGRQIDDLDGLFAPARFTAAGLHGLERRDPTGRLHRIEDAKAELAIIHDALADFAARHPGAAVEDKDLTVALHFRLAPDCAEAAHELADALLRDHGTDLRLQHGKMVVEFRPHGPDKGDVVHSFMAAAPFAGRIPVFAGDDVTDEHGFTAANALGGYSIRIGDPPGGGGSAARARTATVTAFHSWLDQLAKALSV